MYVCVYSCIYIYICVCLCMYIYIYIYVYLCVRVYIYIYIYICVCVSWLIGYSVLWCIDPFQVTLNQINSF